MRNKLQLILFLSLFGAASPTPATPEISLKLKQMSKARYTLIATAPAQHHFSAKAHHYMEFEGFRGRIPPAKVTPSDIRFVLSSQALKPFQVTTYLCDDAKTFCKKQVLRGVWNNKTNALQVSPR